MGSTPWRVAASVSAGLAIASVLVVAYLSGFSQKWGTGSESFLLGNASEVEKIVNPYGTQVVSVGSNFAIVKGAGGGAALLSRSSTGQFTGAMANSARIILTRWSDGFTAIFLKNFTQKEALTLSRETMIAEELAKSEPLGAFVLSEDYILGKSWLLLMKENWAYLIVGSAILYVSYVIFYALFGHTPREE